MVRRGLVLALILSACGGTTPMSPTASAESSPTVATTVVETARPAASPADEPSPAGIPLPSPGRPWVGAALLDEMRGSTRPGGVPDAVQTPQLAGSIAEAVWTVDGAEWDTLAIGGFCGPATCTLDLAGTHVGRAGEDLWTLEVDLESGRVEPIVADVRSLPWDLIDALDRQARSLDDGKLGPMVLSTVRWLPPPAEAGRFVLSYRSGGEEGSCATEILLDADDGEIVERSATSC